MKGQGVRRDARKVDVADKEGKEDGRVLQTKVVFGQGLDDGERYSRTGELL